VTLFEVQRRSNRQYPTSKFSTEQCRHCHPDIRKIDKLWSDEAEKSWIRWERAGIECVEVEVSKVGEIFPDAALFGFLT
jgi:hypothetical protein